MKEVQLLEWQCDIGVGSLVLLPSPIAHVGKHDWIRTPPTKESSATGFVSKLQDLGLKAVIIEQFYG